MVRGISTAVDATSPVETNTSETPRRKGIALSSLRRSNRHFPYGPGPATTIDRPFESAAMLLPSTMVRYPLLRSPAIPLRACDRGERRQLTGGPLDAAYRTAEAPHPAVDGAGRGGL